LNQDSQDLRINRIKKSRQSFNPENHGSDNQHLEPLILLISSDSHEQKKSGLSEKSA